MLILVNTYPLFVVRNLTFTAKQTALENQASVISTSVSTLDSYTPDNVTQVLRLLEIDGMNRVLLTDTEGTVLYSAASGHQWDDREDWGVENALSGKIVFFSRFHEGAYHSSAAMPLYSGDHISGAVYLYEMDESQGLILLQLQRNIRFVSIVICVISVFLSFLFSTTLTRRIRLVLRAVRIVREGQYSFRLELGGNDELTELGDEFNSLTARLQSTEELRRRFVSDASHELKTPLASIRLLSDSILQTPDASPEMVMEFVRDIGSEAERLARTTEKLLNLTRHDNKIEKEPSRVDFSAAAAGALQVLRPIAAAAEVELRPNLGSSCQVLATADDLYQIVINLVENAIKYNVRGGSADIRTFRSRDKVVFTVCDTGIGIPDANLPHIFDRFYRVDKARSRETGGSGLGLSIVRSTVEEYGGTVTADNRVEGGMRFTVTLPYCPSELESFPELEVISE